MGIKSYAYNDKTQLTKNFNVSEFKCKCGGTHNIRLSEELVKKLQEMTDLVKADYVTISSGYRCSKHDKAVGGSGTGPHVDGYAADCCFYKGGKPISSKLLSCVAQDLGFMGIANITSAYTWIHLDMKGRVYKGNEVVNYHTLTSDFYSYYGVTRAEVNKLTGTSTPNNNVSSTTLTTDKINSKDKNSNKFTYSNKYDAKVKELQEILKNKGYSLAVDGYAGPNTYNVCKKFTIEKNDKGPLTRWVQERLKDMKYYTGICDGVAGISTMSAISAFQKANGLGQGYLGGTDWYYIIK